MICDVILTEKLSFIKEFIISLKLEHKNKSGNSSSSENPFWEIAT